MNSKGSVAAVLVGAIVVYAVGYVIFDTIFASFYAANAGSATGVSREPQILWAVLLGSLAYAALITYAMNRGGGSVSLASGAQTGAIVGFLLWATVDLVFYGSTNLNGLTVAMVDPFLEFVRGGISGAVIALVLGKMSGSSSSA
jgi:hypothetical protein